MRPIFAGRNPKVPSEDRRRSPLFPSAASRPPPTERNRMKRVEARRRLPAGAEVLPGGGVDFRVWAPARKSVEVVLEGGPGSAGARSQPSIELAPGQSGYFSGVAPRARAGTLYRYR